MSDLFEDIWWSLYVKNTSFYNNSLSWGFIKNNSINQSLLKNWYLDQESTQLVKWLKKFNWPVLLWSWPTINIENPWEDVCKKIVNHKYIFDKISMSLDKNITDTDYFNSLCD